MEEVNHHIAASHAKPYHQAHWTTQRGTSLTQEPRLPSHPHPSSQAMHASLPSCRRNRENQTQSGNPKTNGNAQTKVQMACSSRGVCISVGFTWQRRQEETNLTPLPVHPPLATHTNRTIFNGVWKRRFWTYRFLTAAGISAVQPPTTSAVPNPYPRGAHQPGWTFRIILPSHRILFPGSSMI